MKRKSHFDTLMRKPTFAQAARVAEFFGHAKGRAGDVGRDDYPDEESVRFVASDRLMLVSDDVAKVEERGGQTIVTANILGLAGATPALPMPYSELQLRRRRLRDFGFSRFLNLFDHRALSFFYRIVRKFSWPLLAERAEKAGTDPVASMLTALAGIGRPGIGERLDMSDVALVPLVAHLADVRRSASNVESVLRAMTGLPLRVIEAEPVWMALPRAEQSWLGAAAFGGAQIGGDNAAVIGAAVLDVQHHFLVEIGPLSYHQLQTFCGGTASRRLVSQLCALAAGFEQRPSMRLLVDPSEIPPLMLGEGGTPALLGWTSWLGRPDVTELVGDCVIPLDRAAMA